MLLTDYLRRVAQRWRVIVATLLVVVATTATVTFLLTPKYESRTRVFVSNSANIEDIGNQMAAGVYAQQKVLSYAAVASSSAMAERVIADLGLKESPREVANKVSTAVEFGTVLVTITVTDDSPTEATAIANSVLENYNALLNRIDSGEGNISPVTISVMEQPSESNQQVSPNVGLNLVAGVFIGLLLGIALAVLRDLLDDTVKGAEDLGDVETSLLGTIPKRGKAGRKGPQLDGPLVDSMERSGAAEALRQLRVNLRFASLDNTPRTILVTSTAPGEGKSFVSANLAAVYAAAGYSTALVDLDLRRPVQAERLGLESGVGVTSVLLGQVSLAEALQPVSSANFYLLASGQLPPNPAEVLATRALSDLIAKLATDFDVVIFDTPPAGMFADARQVAALVDGTILVSRYKRTKRQVLKKTLGSLSDISATVLGVVINLASEKSTGYGGYDGYQYAGARKPEAAPAGGKRSRRAH